MASTPIQYELAAVTGGDATYEGTPGPAQAAQAGEYEKNRQGLRRISLILKDFKPPQISVPKW